MWGSRSQMVKSGRPHSHTMHELLVSLNGFGEQLVEGRKAVFTRGAAFFLPEGSWHHIEIPPEANADIAFVCFETDYFLRQGMAGMHRLTKELASGAHFFSASDPPFLERNVYGISALMDELEAPGPYSADRLCGLLCGLLVDFYRGAVKVAEAKSLQKSGASSSEPLRMLAARIGRAPLDAPTLEDAAKSVHMGRTAFSVAFKRMFGETYLTHVTACRVARSVEALHDGVPVSVAACQGGFSNLGHFHKVFKRVVGMTPLCLKSLAAKQGGRLRIMREAFRENISDKEQPGNRS